jgi:ubiquinone/menaquinone biosynthesis C-methylase UbiE
MNPKTDNVNEAFSKQSNIFDEYEETNDILKWMRSITHKHIEKYLRKNEKILDINAGTGLDAIYLARQGFRVHCIDIAEGMIDKKNKKVRKKQLEDLISYQVLSFTDLDKLNDKLFDYIISNFGGLNCVQNLQDVFTHFGKILKPGGKVTLAIMPHICLWELGLIFRGIFETAFRRLNKNGTEANVEGINFTTYYHSVSKTIKALGSSFRVLEIQGLASVSPLPYMINFPK